MEASEEMKNYTTWSLEDLEVSAEHSDPDYEQFLADVWVGIVLTLMVLSCVCCMCSCLLYHKFQQWKRSVIESRNTATTLESGVAEADLPSYTIASGLPTYQEALEQLKKVNETKGTSSHHQERSLPARNLSVVNLFTLYKPNNNEAATKPA